MTGIGSVVGGKYRLQRLLGDGGMGSVYEATHEVLGTRVAVKVLHADLARRSGLVERFMQEARVAAQIRSPHVVQVTDVDRTPDGVAYLVMELLEGEPLASILDRDRRLDLPRALEYTRQILLALEAAHALSVVHRDLKPENVFLTYLGSSPVLKLIDFGIAKVKRLDASARSLTVAGVVMGTAEYMAPEQAYSADQVDARSDVYSVGVMLYEMVSGVRPVSGDDARVIALRVERGEVKPLVHAAPGVPRELAGLAHRAMAARPELRFSTAAEMRLALEAIKLDPGGPNARPATRVVTPEVGNHQAAMAGLPAQNHAPNQAANHAQNPNMNGSASRLPVAAPEDSKPATRIEGAPPGADIIGSGTVLGAPAAAVLAASKIGTVPPADLSMSPAAPRVERPTGTTVPQDSPPIHESVAMAPPPYGPPMAPPPVMQARSAPRPAGPSGGLIAAVVGLPLLAGAIVGGIYWMQSSDNNNNNDTPALTTPAPSPQPPSPQVSPLPSPDPVQPLGPSPPPRPQPAPGPPGPKPSATTVTDSGSTTPPLIPTFPSAFTFPSVTIPPFPSGFPFPGQPPAPQPPK